jgi:glycerophosphoryl diester phosphodiesterase
MNPPKTARRVAVVSALALLTLGAFCVVRAVPATAPAGPTPLVHAHAHNDYEHPRPLQDALDNGFCSVEADIHLVDGKLLVAHDRAHVRPDRTLQSLYLDPLRERARRNGGRVYPGGPPVVLLVDFKGDAREIWPVLFGVLKEYAPILTVWREGKAQDGAVTVILTGSSHGLLAGARANADAVRFAAFDGILTDLDAAPLLPADLVPWISTQWTKSFTWKGDGPFPDTERAKLRELVERAHAQKRQIRFWDAPDKSAAWSELRAAGVDWINSDDLPGLRAFFARGGR